MINKMDKFKNECATIYLQIDNLLDSNIPQPSACRTRIRRHYHWLHGI